MKIIRILWIIAALPAFLLAFYQMARIETIERYEKPLQNVVTLESWKVGNLTFEPVYVGKDWAMVTVEYRKQ